MLKIVSNRLRRSTSFTAKLLLLLIVACNTVVLVLRQRQQQENLPTIKKPKNLNRFRVIVSVKQREEYNLLPVDRDESTIRASESGKATISNNNRHNYTVVYRTLSSSLDVGFTYTKFTPALPLFLTDEDREFFLSDRDNVRYLVQGERLVKRKGSEIDDEADRELIGRIRMMHNVTVTAENECSWRTAQNEFSSFETRSLKYQLLNDTFMNLSTSLCPLLVPDGHTFQHFMDGVLPKLVQLHNALYSGVSSTDVDDDVTFLLFKPRDTIIHELLRALKVRRTVWVSPPTDSVAYKARYMLDACVTPPIHPALLRGARKLLGVSDLSQSSDVPDRSLFRERFQSNLDTFIRSNQYSGNLDNFLSMNRSLDAGKQRHRLRYRSVVLLSRRFSRNGRRLLNEPAILKYLQLSFGKDQVVLFRSGLNLTSTLALFGQADLLIGVHGGAFYNVHFAPSNATVIELMPTITTDDDNAKASGAAHRWTKKRRMMGNGLAHTVIWRICSALGQRYWRIYLDGATRQRNVILPLDKLAEILDRSSMLLD